jgi:hypothetical protein
MIYGMTSRFPAKGFPQIYTDEPLIFAEGPAPGRIVELRELDGWPYYHLKPNALCVISGKISENLREKIS